MIDRQQKNEIDMLHGPLLRKMVLFALPLAAGSILQMVFNLADTAVVGRFAGSTAMAAVGGNGAIINLLVSVFIGLSIGSNVAIARAIGQKKSERIKSGTQTTIALSIASGIFLMIIGLILASWLLTITGVPKNVMPEAILYLRIYFLGTPFLVVYNFGAAILRSRGDSKRPLYILILTGCINVALNLILVIIFNLGVAGVGIATLIANIINMVLILWILVREEEPYKLNLRNLYFDRKMVKEILIIGLPSGLQGAVFSFSNTVIQSAINSFGAATIAGSSAALSFEGIGYFGLNSFVNTATTFTGQNYGAGEHLRCKKIFTRALICGALVTLILNYVAIIFRQPLLSLFSTEAAVISVASQRFMRVLSFQWIASSYEISGACLRGMGYSMLPTTLVVFGTCILRLLWVALVFPKFHSFEYLMLVYPVTWVVTGIITLIAYFIIVKKKLKKDLTI